MVVSGVDEPPDGLEVWRHVAGAHDLPGDRALVDQLAGLLEVPGAWQLLCKISCQPRVRPPFESDPARFLVRTRPAHRELPVAWLPPPAGMLERSDQVGLRSRPDEAITQAARQFRRRSGSRSDHDLGWLVG